MAWSKVGGTTAGGALTGAQIGGAIGGPLGAGIGAGVGAIGGLAVGALQKEDPVLEAQRKAARLEKIKGKDRVGLKSGKKVREKLRADIKAAEEASPYYTEQKRLAEQPIVGETAPLIVNQTIDPRLAQAGMAGGTGAPVAAAGDQVLLDATRNKLQAQLDERAALNQMATKERAGQQVMAIEQQAQAQKAAADQQAIQTGAALGQAGAGAVQMAKQAKYVAELDKAFDLPEMDKDHPGYEKALAQKAAEQQLYGVLAGYGNAFMPGAQDLANQQLKNAQLQQQLLEMQLRGGPTVQTATPVEQK